MSNNFWIGLAAIGVGAWWLLRSKPASGSPGNPDMVSQGTTLGGGTSAYGQFPGYVQAGAAGVVTDPSRTGTLDNSRVFDPYAQGAASYTMYQGGDAGTNEIDGLSLSGIDPATGLPYPDRSMQLDGGGTGQWTQGNGYQYRQGS